MSKDVPVTTGLITARAKIVARALTDNGLEVTPPDEATLDDVEWERWNVCLAIVQALDDAAPEAPTRRRKEPTGMNIYGETQAEYYARVSRERGAEIERLRSGIQAMLDGNYPHPRAYRSDPGMECPHGIPYYQDCGACNDAWLQGLLS